MNWLVIHKGELPPVGGGPDWPVSSLLADRIKFALLYFNCMVSSFDTGP